MKRIIAVLTALLLMLGMTTHALALENSLFTMDYEPTAQDTVGEVSTSQPIVLFPFANNGDTLSQIEISYSTVKNGVSDMTEEYLRSSADVLCISIEAMRDGTSIFTDAECVEVDLFEIDGKKAAYFMVKTTWNSVNMPGVSTDMYMATYMIDLEDGSLTISNMAIAEATAHEFDRLIKTIEWKENAAVPAAQTSGTGLGQVYDYGDFTMAYTPGDSDTIEGNAAPSFSCSLTPFADSGDATTNVVISWQPGGLDLSTASDSDVEMMGEILLEGLFTGIAQSGIEPECKNPEYKLIEMDGLKALQMNAECAYDLRPMGVDIVTSVYITFVFAPVEFTGGVYAFVGMTENPDQLAQLTPLFETVTWND